MKNEIEKFAEHYLKLDGLTPNEHGVFIATTPDGTSMNLVYIIEDFVKTFHRHIIQCLGEPVIDNEYIIKPDVDGDFWITHNHIGSGELLEDFLNG